MKTSLLFLVRLVLFFLLAMTVREWFYQSYNTLLSLGVDSTSIIPFKGARVLHIIFVLVLATPRPNSTRMCILC